MPYTRRTFLKTAAGLSALALMPPITRTFAAQAARRAAQTDYLTAMETPYAAPMNLPFERVLGAANVGLLLYEVSAARLLVALQPENPLPVASAFKAPLLMYFVDQVPREVWASVPVEHWNAASSSGLPAAYREAWTAHQHILRALYQTIVLSDNATTGTVLGYVAAAHDETDAVRRFNDWAQETVGVSQLSGLSAWGQGIPGGMTYTDARFNGRGTTISGQVYPFDNMMTPRDLGLFYVWMLAEMDAQGQRVCRNLLSTIYNNRGANLERLALAQGGTPYSKNGSLETDAGYVVTDAGLMALPDGREYLLVMLSLNAPAVLSPLFEELDATLDGKYNEMLHNRHTLAVSSEELRAAYVTHLEQAYPQPPTPDESGAYRYGFIIPAGVAIFRHPREDAQLHNPIIKSTRFGIHLLMQGALVRYLPVDDEWAELIPDNDRDNVRSRLGVQVFVRQRDLWPISLAHALPIASLVEDGIAHTDKTIIISLQARELVAFEGGTAILRVPIVLNVDFTPRGAQVITSKWFARSMQPWAPGVPFTSFFGSRGFALHGSPWQRWGTTVNQGNITGRTSAGCVNVPDWLVTVGDFTRPADELLFRWIGGLEQPNAAVFEYPSDAYPALRIYNVDYPHNLYDYVRPAGLVSAGLGWDDVIDQMAATPLQAPDSFLL